MALAALLMSAGGASLAATHYLVVPMPAKGGQVEPAVSVVLSQGVLPKAKLAKAYSYGFEQHLSVTGDSAYTPGSAVFSATGPLPEGLALQPNGMLSGTPTKASTGQNFEIEATYKTKSGTQVFSLVVGDGRLEATKVVIGDWHACAITPQGAVFCWGQGNQGQLGNGLPQNSGSPVQVTGLTQGVTDIAVGTFHSCAVRANAAFCWGSSLNLGNGATVSSSTPVGVLGLTSGVSKIAAGSASTCAIQSGALKCWGNNGNGQLGNGEILAEQRTPVQVQTLTAGVTDVSISNHACAVQNGAVMCWGQNAFGQVGDGTTLRRETPVQLASILSGATAVSVGTRHSCAIVSGGLKCWGYSLDNQLGHHIAVGYEYVEQPIDVSAMGSGVQKIATGSKHTCAVRSGAVYCWGGGASGQLGMGDNADRAWATVESSGLTSGVTALSAGGSSTCAVHSGIAKCWGVNTRMQLGDGTTTSRNAPVSVLE